MCGKPLDNSSNPRLWQQKPLEAKLSELAISKIWAAERKREVEAGKVSRWVCTHSLPERRRARKFPTLSRAQRTWLLVWEWPWPIHMILRFPSPWGVFYRLFWWEHAQSQSSYNLCLSINQPRLNPPFTLSYKISDTQPSSWPLRLPTLSRVFFLLVK